MSIQLSDKHKGLIQKIGEFKETLISRNRQMDETQEFPWDVCKLFYENHILDLPIPEAYGGGGSDSFSCCLVIEEIARFSPSAAHMLAGHWLGFTPLEMYCNSSQKDRYFPRLRSELAAFALTEPAAGSDAGGVMTKAVREGKRYVLNGNKIYCTQGNEARVVTIFAKTDPKGGVKGLSAFIVEKAFPGFSVGKIEEQMGMRGTPAAELVLQDCSVPEENLLGKESNGFNIAMSTLDRTRPKDAALSVGIAQGALDYVLVRAKQGFPTSLPPLRSQGVQFILADMAIAIEAARLMVYEAAALIDEGKVSTKQSAMAKCLATDTAMKVADQGIEILGAEGVTAEHPIEMFERDAKLLQIVEGTNQIQRLIISRMLLS
jgi:alkylation response protein AidB-like acyl-CoA dehydrogenase